MTYHKIPCVGTEVCANHPITPLNPNPHFKVTEISYIGGRFSVRGENTCWFGVQGIVPLQSNIFWVKVNELLDDSSVVINDKEGLEICSHGYTQCQVLGEERSTQRFWIRLGLKTLSVPTKCLYHLSSFYEKHEDEDLSYSTDPYDYVSWESLRAITEFYC